ncbi:MAG TPA: hypothetical protein EYP90_07290 [Chromatiaceae bacterium]|nr:hypothetical protein [Chromatiaceae bacterium]
MGGNVFWPVVTVSVIAVFLAVMLPGGRPPEPARHLPWQIEVLPDGGSRVFGITLGKSTLAEVEQQFQEEAEVSLFVADSGARVAEAFFNSVTLNGLKARMVVTLGFSDDQLQQLFERGVRISTLGQGRRKVTLSGPDLLLARNTPVVALTYLPRINLDGETVQKRFGAPARRIAEAGGKIVHWLYPDKGLDIVISEEGREVLQYVPPGRFEQLLKPLEEMSLQSSSG